jgi:hypothetical protein
VIWPSEEEGIFDNIRRISSFSLFPLYVFLKMMTMKKKEIKIEYLNNDKDLPGYPEYPASEDIYSKGEEESEIDPEDITRNKELEESENLNVKDFYDDETGADLDIPGSELDDELEDIGSEDEENNYYSIGGDDHNNLDEDDDNRQ